VFIDWNQNAGHETTVAFYSLRARRQRPARAFAAGTPRHLGRKKLSV
jgi:DNA primase